MRLTKSVDEFTKWSNLNTKAKRKKKTATLPPTTLPLITPTKTEGHLPISTHPDKVRRKYFISLTVTWGGFQFL